MKASSNNNSSSGSLTSRGDARISVAEKWANRRKLQEEHHLQQQLENKPENNNNNSTAKKTNRPPLSLPEHQAPFSIPPLCVLLRRSWNQTVRGFVQQQNNIKNGAQQQKKTTVAVKSEGSSSSNKRVTFPSVLSVLKANAVKLQVESMLMEEEDTENEEIEPTTSDGRLSVLPANYDFTTSAVNHMSESRSRAFLLLDFSAIVQTHTIWRKRLQKKTKPNNTGGAQMVYSARHNCNPRLLQLFNRLGVGLRVATKYDLAAVRQALQKGDGNPDTTDALLWDDTSILVKPNSFYRNLLLNSRTVVTEDVKRRRIPITVSSAEEMERIHDQLHKIWNRRRNRSNSACTMPKLDFVLKLENNAEEWKTSLTKIRQKAQELSDTQVVGVALELVGDKVETTTVQNKSNTDSVLLAGLSNLIDNWVNRPLVGADETVPPSPPFPQVHLTNPITATEIDPSVIDWIDSHRKICTTITIDVSRLLIANAAALCARIIGVKNNDSKTKPNDARDESPKENDEHSNAIQQHLYIDDGCYGSLSNYPNEGTPLPLKSQRLVRALSSTSKELLERDQKTLVRTTVWGPTCKSSRA